MTKIIAIKDLEPEAYKAMMPLENYSKSTQITSRIKELNVAADVLQINI